MRIDDSPSRTIVFATGGWLGAAQVSVGYALLVSGGASASRYFAFIAAWIGGGALASLLVSRKRALNAIFLGGALSALTLACLVLDRWPFSRVSLAAGFVAAATSGAYGGFFISALGRGARDTRRFLLWENNGFLAGFASASVMLFVSLRALEGGVLVSGIALVASHWPPRRQRREAP